MLTPPDKNGMLRCTDPKLLLATFAKGIGFGLPAPTVLCRQVMACLGTAKYIEIGLPVEGKPPYVLVGYPSKNEDYLALRRAGFVRQSARCELICWVGRPLEEVEDLDRAPRGP